MEEKTLKITLTPGIVGSDKIESIEEMKSAILNGLNSPIHKCELCEEEFMGAALFFQHLKLAHRMR